MEKRVTIFSNRWMSFGNNIREVAGSTTSVLLVESKTLHTKFVNIADRSTLSTLVERICLVLLINLLGINLFGQQFAPAVETHFGIEAGWIRQTAINDVKLVDIDTDGDLDCFVIGEMRIAFYRNIGTSQVAEYILVEFNPYGLYDFAEQPLSINAVDMDMDNDYDFIIGSASGLAYTENVGNSAHPSYGPRTNFPFNLNNSDIFTASFGDIDADGDLDVIAGGKRETYLFKNTGDAHTPYFDEPLFKPFGLQIDNKPYFPEFIDADKDGDLDVFAGGLDGRFVYFENIGLANAPIYHTPKVNPFGLKTAIGISNPEFGDIDADGDLDLFVGAGYSQVLFYKNLTKNVGDVHVWDELKVHPNPVVDNLEFEIGSSDIVRVELISPLGEVLLATDKQEDVFNMSAYVPGVYYLRAYDKFGQVSNQMVVKE